LAEAGTVPGFGQPGRGCRSRTVGSGLAAAAAESDRAPGAENFGLAARLGAASFAAARPWRRALPLRPSGAAIRRARDLRVPWPRSLRGLRARSSSRWRSSSARRAASSASRALAARSAARRRSISASEIPAGRFDGSPEMRCRVVSPHDAQPAPGVPGLHHRGHHNALALGFDHDAFRPAMAEALLHLSGTGGTPPRPRGFLPSVSLMRPTYPSWREPPSAAACMHAARPEPCRFLYNTRRESTSRKRGVYRTFAPEGQTHFPSRQTPR
jgi:hypothetical protein